ncbi:hypothetical protein GQ44DRAFT_148188 [Phaeosphaeriaceae sp. PMI808]|nr:hypothetical protein GQ44DRAFT_148188 [Phaeosphaeriaceae sp. PMI808]
MISNATSHVRLTATESAFLAVAFFNVVELHFIFFSAFKRRSTLYFWSVGLTTWGILLNGLGVVLNDWVVTDGGGLAHRLPIMTLLLVGWYMMVTGFSVVLYSRLHLLVDDHRKLRAVLYLIIFSAVVMHIPITCIIYLMTTGPPGKYDRLFSIYEPLQLIWFSLQEAIISGLYIYYAARTLPPMQSFRKNAGSVLRKLVSIDIFVVILDITMVGVELGGYDALQHFYKVFVYSIRLKLEFVILNQLLELVQPSPRCGDSLPNYGSLHERSKRKMNPSSHTDEIPLADVDEGPGRINTSYSKTSFEHVSRPKPCA